MDRPVLEGFVPPHALSGMAQNTPILVAFSGGADSSALLVLLAEYAKKTGAPLSVAHVDHKLRGSDSDADREFCRARAETLGLPFYTLSIDVAGLAEQQGKGIEEQARLVRYEFFADVMRKHNIPLLATAHNTDDNAETVVFHLTRGSGLRGMCGIPPTRPLEFGTVIRPLLGVCKADIVDFCKRNSIPFVTDRTNDDVTYARNRIRHRVLPELTAINGGALANVSRLSSILREDEDFMSKTAAEFLAKHAPDGTLELCSLASVHPAIASRAISMLLTELTDDVRAVHVRSVMELVRAAVPHSSLDLGDGVRATIENGRLVLGSIPPTDVPSRFCYSLHEGETPIPEADALILIEKDEKSGTFAKNTKSFKNIYKKATTTRISFDRIKGSLTAEPRREGDVILTGGMHKKVKKLMCEKKLPLPLRNRLPILRDGHGIVWIPEVALRDGMADGNATATVTLFYND